MKVAIVIPTRNAVAGGHWLELLKAVAAQSFIPARKIVIDSDSTDDTRALAAQYGWECRKIRLAEFNHGRTRNEVVRELAGAGIDAVIFLSQDVIPTAPDTLTRLTDFLCRHPETAGVYGRQQVRKEGSLDFWQRTKCYPEQSAVKTLLDTGRLGLMTPFFSNAFAAWKTAEVRRFGGFPATDFGEDMLLAAAVLEQGGAIGYCAEAAVVHEHSNCFADLFCRGRQVGRMHREHPELLRRFGTIRPPAGLRPPVRIWIPLGIKMLGYCCGRCF